MNDREHTLQGHLRGEEASLKRTDGGNFKEER